MSYKEFIKNNQSGTLKNTMFFYGAENLLIRWAIRTVIGHHVSEEERDYAVTELQGEEARADAILSAAGTYGMFLDKRIVLVRNYEPLYRKTPVDGAAEEARILEFAASAQDSAILIFYLDSMYAGQLTAFGRKLAKTASGYEFDRLDKAQLKAFISKRLRNEGRMIGHREMEQLIDLTGYYNKESEYTLDVLERDLFKLARAGEESVIEAKLIEEIMVGDRDRFVFHFIDALMAGDKRKAMTLVANMLVHDPDSAMPVSALLMGQFEMMFDALELEEAGQSLRAMPKTLGVNEYRFKKAYTAARSMGRERIEKALTMLYDANRALTAGEMDQATSLELFVLSV